jgi:hypothetical protein
VGKKNKIILLKGASQYQAIDTFMDELHKAIQSTPYHSEIINLSDPTEIATYIKRNHDSIIFVLSFNLNGCTLQTEQQPIYDYYKIPLVSILLDHPFYHLGRLQLNIKHRQIICVDKVHQHFLKRFFNIKADFLPQGGIDISKENEEPPRDIDLLFAGTIHDIEEEQGKLEIDPTFEPIIKETSDYLLDQPTNTPLIEAYMQCCKQHNLKDASGNIPVNTHVLLAIDTMTRSLKRQKLLKTLLSAGLPVTCITQKLPQVLHSFEGGLLTHIPSMPFNKLLPFYRRSKLTLNVLPNYAVGAHERIFTAMLAGSVCISDNNHYLDTILATGKDSILFAWNDIDALPGIINTLITDPALLKHIAKAGHTTALNHTWEKRLRTLFDIMGVA